MTVSTVVAELERRLAEFEAEECHCDEAWRGRDLTDPTCLPCAIEDAVSLARDAIIMLREATSTPAADAKPLSAFVDPIVDKLKAGR